MYVFSFGFRAQIVEWDGVGWFRDGFDLQPRCQEILCCCLPAPCRAQPHASLEVQRYRQAVEQAHAVEPALRLLPSISRMLRLAVWLYHREQSTGLQDSIDLLQDLIGPREIVDRVVCEYVIESAPPLRWHCCSVTKEKFSVGEVFLGGQSLWERDAFFWTIDAHHFAVWKVFGEDHSDDPRSTTKVQDLDPRF